MSYQDCHGRGIHAVMSGFDHAFVLRDFESEMINRNVALEAYVDSKTVFDFPAKQRKT